jgi:ubiquinone/menaquinone biosynthesis C-methylase UbiE
VPRADIRTGDAAELPWDDDSVAVALLMLVLSSLDGDHAPATVLAEARRVLAPGGLLVIWEPRIANPAGRMTRTIRLRKLREALDDDIDVSTLTVLPQLARRLGAATDALYPRLARVPALRSHRLVVYPGQREVRR